MEEFLVLLACLNSKGCSETSQFYYDTKPELQLSVRKLEYIVTSKIGEAPLTFLAPPLVYMVGGSGVLKLSSSFSIELSKNVTSLNFKKEF